MRSNQQITTVGLYFMCIIFAGTYVAPAQTTGPSDKIVDCSVTVGRRSYPKTRIISAGVVNGKSVNLVKPEYPASARAVGVRGSVQIQVLIDQAGCVTESKVLSGHPL